MGCSGYGNSWILDRVFLVIGILGYLLGCSSYGNSWILGRVVLVMGFLDSGRVVLDFNILGYL